MKPQQPSKTIRQVLNPTAACAGMMNWEMSSGKYMIMFSPTRSKRTWAVLFFNVGERRTRAA